MQLELIILANLEGPEPSVEVSRDVFDEIKPILEEAFKKRGYNLTLANGETDGTGQQDN